MYFAGIDTGSLSTEAVIIAENDIIHYTILPTGSDGVAAARDAYNKALTKAGIDEKEVTTVVSTGYGRHTIDFATKAVTEITCHALGAEHVMPEAKTVIDIGGQDSKVIKLATDGRVEDFAMNDKCAAGTGRFLEVMANTLETTLEDMQKISQSAIGDVKISNTCTVFAESEVVGLLARGTDKSEIARALHQSVALRIVGMVKRLRADGPYVATGGVAKNTGVIREVGNMLGADIYVWEEPQIIGALGAALHARAISG